MAQPMHDTQPTQANLIKLKEEVSSDVRTADRDRVAEHIKKHFARSDGIVNMHDLKMQTVANELGYSRQHVANTINKYFDVVDSPSQPDLGGYDADIRPRPSDDDEWLPEVPEDLDDRSFLYGYIAGLTSGKRNRR